jgi:hypothetical protein
MKELVSNRRVMITVVAAMLSVLWAILVGPASPLWTTMITLGALALLLVSTVVMGLRTRPPTSLEAVIRNVEMEKPRRKS